MVSTTRNGNFMASSAMFSTATISISETEVCQFQTPAPIVTFTGADGTAPYTFTYNINGGGKPNRNDDGQ